MIITSEQSWAGDDPESRRLLLDEVIGWVNEEPEIMSSVCQRILTWL